METSILNLAGGVCVVRFHLGSGINGNLSLFVREVLENIVRFHLGSGINGNTNFWSSKYRATPQVRFHLGSGINGNLKRRPPGH